MSGTDGRQPAAGKGGPGVDTYPQVLEGRGAPAKGKDTGMAGWRWAAMVWVTILAVAGFAGAAADPSVDQLLEGIERRYSGSGFTARFFQESTLKAMGVTDTAAGELYVKYPGKMRWEYTRPDPLLFVSDGETVWIYKPQENQVSVGRADQILGDNQGASFLSDIRLLRRRFQVSLEPDAGPQAFRLKLIPREASPDLSAIYLSVDRARFEVLEVLTTNVYEDQTRIRFENLRFDQGLPDEVFHFDIPEGADVLVP
jgi:outer membrane lipoprotein carrier protein